MISVRTLGTAEVRAGALLITPESAMLFALALFLSVSAGQRVQRARLLDLFWPDSQDGLRRHALRQLLYRLRREGFPLSQDGEELLVGDDAVDSDVRRVLGARWPEEAGDEEVVSAERVLPGYDPAMPELYREWLDELRSRVHSQYRRAVLRKIEMARRAGRWPDVSDWARRCLSVDPLNEEATLAHAEAIAMTGSKATALQIIDEYLNELGDRGRLIGLPAKVLRRRVSESAPTTRRDEVSCVRLVGRERELARLNELLAGTMAGSGAAVFVVGAAGIGKSRLTQDLLASAALRGWRPLTTRLQSGDSQRPLGVFVDLFTGLMQMSGALGCAPESIAQLRLLTRHDLREAAESKLSQEAEAVQDRLRAAATDLVESVVSEGPLILMIDDLHWCDDASIRLLQYLIARTAELPLMWLLTARPEGCYERLQLAVSDLRMEIMRLAPLTSEDALALFESLAMQSRVERSGALIEYSNGVAAGNPLFVLELAQHFRATGLTTSLPQSLRALIRDRTSRLSSAAQHLLHTCAVLGRYASVSRVASVLEIGTPDLLTCIDELDALGIVGTGRDEEALAIHDLWRDELLKALLPASRILLHHRCGLVLENECRTSRSPSIAWEAAQHLLAAGSSGRALSILEDCAQHQMDNGLPIDAARSFDLAYMSSSTNADRLRATNGKLAALRKAAKWDEIRVLIPAAVELSNASTLSTNPHSDLELLQTEVLWRTESDFQRSLSRARACATDKSASTAHRAHAAWQCAVVADNICHFADLELANEVAVNLSTASSEARANLLCVRVIFETILGSLEAAEECSSELIRLERTAGSVRGLSRALRYSCHSARMLGRFDQALSMTGEALELAESHGLVGEAASAADLILAGHLERSDVESAAAWLPRSQVLAGKVGAQYAPAGLQFNQAIYALLLGDHEQAMRCVSTYAVRFEADPLIRQRMLFLSILARIYVARGDSARLVELAPALHSALALRRSTGAHDYHVASYALLLEFTGDREAAIAYVSEFATRGRRDRTPISRELARFL